QADGRAAAPIDSAALSTTVRRAAVRVPGHPTCRGGPMDAWMRRMIVLVCGLALSAVPVQAQRDTVLTIGGDVERPYALSAAEFEKLPHVNVRATGHDGKAANYEGVRVSDLLRAAGVKFGSELRGERMAYALIVGAGDGYRAAFAVAELDSGFTERE